MTKRKPKQPKFRTFICKSCGAEVYTCDKKSVMCIFCKEHITPVSP